MFYTDDTIFEMNSDKNVPRFFGELGGTYCIVRDRYLRDLRRELRKLGLGMYIVDQSHYRFTTVTVKREATQPRRDDPPPAAREDAGVFFLPVTREAARSASAVSSSAAQIERRGGGSCSARFARPGAFWSTSVCCTSLIFRAWISLTTSYTFLRASPSVA